MIAEQVAEQHLGNSLHAIEHSVAGGAIHDVWRDTQFILAHGVVTVCLDRQSADYVRWDWIVIAAFAKGVLHRLIKNRRRKVHRYAAIAQAVRCRVEPTLLVVESIERIQPVGKLLAV